MHVVTRLDFDSIQIVVKDGHDATLHGAFSQSARYGPSEWLICFRMAYKCGGGAALFYASWSTIETLYELGMF